MKTGLWILILALTSWTINGDRFISIAMANTLTVATSTHTTTWTDAARAVHTNTTLGFSTTTNADTGGPGTSTGTNTNSNCSSGGQQYGGGQWNWCNRADPAQQQNTQNDTKDLNNNASNQSSMLGMAAIAAGMAMVVSGTSMLPNPSTHGAGVALDIAGALLIASGIAALSAAGEMNNNANKANSNLGNLQDISPYQSGISSQSSTSTVASTAGNPDLGSGSTGGIKIDPALTRSGKLDTIFGNMEAATGLNRDAMIQAVTNGANPLDVLANSPALAGKSGASSANLHNIMDDATAKGSLPSGQDVMNKLGLSAGDLTGSANASGNGVAGGGDPNRGLASTSGASLDSLFPGYNSVVPSDSKSSGTSMKMSPEVKAALDKNGITSRTIFEMVHTQYNKKTPMLFGVQKKQQSGTNANPFANLSGDKVEF